MSFWHCMTVTKLSVFTESFAEFAGASTALVPEFLIVWQHWPSQLAEQLLLQPTSCFIGVDIRTSILVALLLPENSEPSYFLNTVNCACSSISSFSALIFSSCSSRACFLLKVADFASRAALSNSTFKRSERPEDVV